MSSVLVTKNLYKDYMSSAGKVSVLKGIDVSFEEGRFYAIIGKSGSGKSTLLQILGGLDRPTEGNVYIEDTDISSYNDEKMAMFRRRHMGFIFQQYNLLEEYSVYQNICMPLTLDGKKPDQAFFDEVTDIMGIRDKLKKYPSELSGGEQQRVAIARAIISRPKLILADEPTGNLDKQTGENIMDLLTNCVKKYGQTLIMVTHDLEMAERADSIVKIEDGKIKDNKE